MPAPRPALLAALALLATPLGSACGGSSKPVSLGQSHSGIATYYDADGTGNCSFDTTSDPVAAINAAQYDQAAFCGACAQVDGPHGSVVVRIVDKCPDCEENQLDLGKSAFAKIADLSAGRVPISWKIVSCDVGGSVSYRFKEGSSQWWTAIQVRNHRLPISKLEVKSSGSWVELPREDYNYFVAEKGVGPDPFDIRITASTGEQLTDHISEIRDGQVVDGHAQFE